MISRKKEKLNFSERGALDEEAMLAYLNNELAPEETQKFEALLKDDPFAQEALEGLQSTHHKIAVIASVASLNKKVRERSGLKEKAGFQIQPRVFAYAAGLVGLLLSIGFLLITYVGNNKEQIAMQTEKQTEQSLLEQKVEQQNLISAKQEAVADSTATSTLPATNVSSAVAPTGNTVTKPLPDINGTEQQALRKKDEPVTLTKSTQGILGSSGSAGKVAQTITVTNSTLTATTNNAAAPAAVSAGVVLNIKGKAKEELEQDERNVRKQVAAKSEKKAAEKNGYAKDQNALKQNDDKAPTTQKVVRGSIVETEELDKASVVSIDDAMRSFNSGDYKKSSQQFDEILRETPKSADALYFGGISDYINGNSKKSEKNFDKLLKEGTKFVEGSKWYKANILLQKGKKEEAKKFLDELANTGGSYRERATKKKVDAGL
ncbi:MAG: hypothetical protein NTY88_01820 [Bacteroidetes bacterium]|nr:hypothetical protein [Bacteroidota bacterium]